MEANTLHQVHTDDGYRCALVVTVGPKFTGMIWIDDRSPGVRINKILNSQVTSKPLEYPLAKAKKLFRSCGKKLGITKAARRALRA